MRCGLVLESTRLPRWAYLSLERALAGGDAEVRVVVVGSGREAVGSGPLPREGTLARATYEMVLRVDRAAFGRGADAWDTVDVAPLLRRAEAVVLDLGRAGDGHEKASAALAEADLDVIVRLGNVIPGLEIEPPSRAGVWTVAFGEEPTDGPCGWHEVLEGRSTTVARLTAALPGRPAVELCRTRVRTYRYSVGQNRSGVAWTAASFVPRELARLRAIGPTAFFARVAGAQNASETRTGAAHAMTAPGVTAPQVRSLETPTPTPSTLDGAASARAPTVKDSLTLLWRQTLRASGRAVLDLVTRPQWYLHVFRGEAAELSIPPVERAQSTIVPPSDRFWADPQIVEGEDGTYVFVEEELARVGRGRIAVMKLRPDGGAEPATTVLEAEHHLSYPFVFAWRGNHYMVPESEAAKRVDLLVATEFPAKWRHVATLLEDVRASDATLLWRDGRWWMFVAIAENRGGPKDAELFLYFSDRLTEGWQPHPENPIVSDVCRARPAGALYEQDGVLYRPAQDCSVRYGYGMHLHAVEVLTPTDYRERVVASTYGDGGGGVLGRHTLARVPGTVVTDALRRRPRGP